MQPQQTYPCKVQGMRRRDVLKAGLAAGATMSVWPLRTVWSAEAGQPKRGGIRRVRGYDPVHFDHHLTINFKTNTILSFTHSTLVRYKVGPDVRPGTFTAEPHLAARWEQPDDTTFRGRVKGAIAPYVGIALSRRRDGFDPLRRQRPGGKCMDCHELRHSIQRC